MDNKNYAQIINRTNMVDLIGGEEVGIIYDLLKDIPTIKLVDITDRTDVEVGMYYDELTGTFSWENPIVTQPQEPTQADKIEENQISLMLASAEQYEKQMQLEENQMSIMMAIADLYEMNGGM